MSKRKSGDPGVWALGPPLWMPSSTGMTMRLVGVKRKEPIFRAGRYCLQLLARDPRQEARNSYHDT